MQQHKREFVGMQEKRSNICNAYIIQKILFQTDKQDPCGTLGLPRCQWWARPSLPAPDKMGVNVDGKEGGASLG